MPRVFVKTMQDIPKDWKIKAWEKHTTHYKSKCSNWWCKKEITPFTFDVILGITENKGGFIEVGNLIPVCHNCYELREAAIDYLELHRPMYLKRFGRPLRGSELAS